MIKEEKINRKIAKNRVTKNLAKLEQSNKTIKDIYDITFSCGTYTMFNVMTSYSYKEITYNAANDSVKNFAGYFHNIIPDTEKYIAIYLDNCVEWIYSFYGLLMAGFTPVLLSTSNDSISNKYVCEKLNIKFVVSDKRFEDLTSINPFKVSTDKKLEKENWPNEIVLISSGTTGNPKIVYYDGNQLSEQIKNAGKILLDNPLISSSYKGYLKQIAILPFYHIFGLVAVFMWFTFFNTTIVIPLNLSPLAIRQACLLAKVTHIFAVPLFWKTITSEIKKFCENNNLSKKFNNGINISLKIQKLFWKNGPAISRKLFSKYLGNILGDSIRFCINGGAFLDPESFKIINGLGYTLVNGYGSTETGITSLCNSKILEDRLSNSIGLPFDTIEYKISNVDGEDHLLVKGSSIAKKIILPSGQEASLIDNYIDTLDCVEFNEKYFLKGRSDEIAVLNNGQNFSLPLLEQNFSFPKALDYVLITRKEKDGFNLLISYKKGTRQKIISEEIQSFIKTNKFNLIFNIFITYEKFPKSNNLKIRRNVVEEKFYSDMDYHTFDKTFENKCIDESVDSDIMSRMMKIFSSIFPDAEIKNDSDFYLDLNGDSLKYFTLLSLIRDEFAVEISYNPNLRTPTDFARQVEGI